MQKIKIFCCLLTSWIGVDAMHRHPKWFVVHKELLVRHGAQSKSKRCRLTPIAWTKRSSEALASNLTLSDLSDYLLAYIAQFVDCKDAASVRSTCRRMRYAFWDSDVAFAIDEKAPKDQFLYENYWFAILVKALVVQNLIHKCNAYNPIKLQIEDLVFFDPLPVEYPLLLTSLKSLTIKKTTLKAALLSHVSMMTGLQELRLNDLDEANQDSLSFISKLTDLRVLDLSGNFLNQLPQLANLKKLSVLILQHNRLDTESVEPLCPLKQMQTLDLSYNGRMNGISEIIKQLPDLKELDLRGCMVPARDRQKLRTKFSPHATTKSGLK